MRCLLAFLLLAAALQAQDMPKRHFWTASVLAVCAAHGVDIASSYGKREVNPAMPAAHFGAGDVALIGGISAGVLVMEWAILRHHPQSEKSFAVVNYATAGAVSAVAVHNFTVKGGGK